MQYYLHFCCIYIMLQDYIWHTAIILGGKNAKMAKIMRNGGERVRLVVNLTNIPRINVSLSDDNGPWFSVGSPYSTNKSWLEHTKNINKVWKWYEAEELAVNFSTKRWGFIIPESSYNRRCSVHYIEKCTSTDAIGQKLKRGNTSWPLTLEF